MIKNTINQDKVKSITLQLLNKSTEELKDMFNIWNVSATIYNNPTKGFKHATYLHKDTDSLIYAGEEGEYIMGLEDLIREQVTEYEDELLSYISVSLIDDNNSPYTPKRNGRTDQDIFNHCLLVIRNDESVEDNEDNDLYDDLLTDCIKMYVANVDFPNQTKDLEDDKQLFVYRMQFLQSEIKDCIVKLQDDKNLIINELQLSNGYEAYLKKAYLFEIDLGDNEVLNYDFGTVNPF
jgi:hypothetical protein